MKRTLFVTLGTALFLALLLWTSRTASAANTTCVSNPSKGNIGTTFTLSCTGFVPGEHAFAWFTEPDGHVFALNSLSDLRADSSGVVSVSFPTTLTGLATTLGGSLREVHANLALGQWAATVKGSSAIGLAYFWLNGGTEGVSGASLNVTSSGFVTGNGFAPGERVEIWYDYPNGDCSGICVSTWGLYPDKPGGMGLSTVTYGSVTASSAGSIAFQFALGSTECKGTYHIVARGNTSHNGADGWWTTPNVDVTTNATMIANPTSTSAWRGSIQFFGSGFNANSHVFLWQTTPQGQVIAEGSVPTGSAGTFVFTLDTGDDLGFAASSEGALGQYALTASDGTHTAIANFWIYGNITDP
jgi:hypothetical protein